MLAASVEERFRALLRGDWSLVVVGGKHRQDFVQAWLAVLADPDVEAVLRHMLFVPCLVPDYEQGCRLCEIVDYLRGSGPSPQLFDDVVVAEAEVLEVQRISDGEGPSYRVTYAYGQPGSGPIWRHECTFGYDSMHAAMNGWDRESLNQYWGKGRRLRCHYRAHAPESHAVCAP